ncbi:hypothetical protein CYLTODRAFT_381216 [Cylindrobasidium torrendii FP15055 ss-10]|uniref:Cupin 2 conserved barrel domain-containing protein n=1 Tax=Cylindrobasidium torrendii FP15055 ss-10 TaxID=1314674 RepID=A0A0D7B3W0_9AGAR|nr:hypothetical protein CYLTODRAFT_381216 [Cylindrobasidium torrendii FP15055 ss-10]
MALPEAQNIRRVITGHDAQGVANIQIDQPLEWTELPQFSAKGSAVWVVDDGLPTNDNNSNEDGARRPLDPGNLTPKDGPGAFLNATRLAPGGTTAMHRTSSQDYNILTQGELVLVMEDGSETHLRTPGDSVVMRGGLHAWKNPSQTQWAQWVTVLVSAKPVVIEGKTLDPMVKS